MRALPRGLANIAARQHGVFHRAQLAPFAVSRQVIHQWSTAGWVTREGANVYRVRGAPRTPLSRMMAASLDAGRGAALSHWTAALLFGFLEAAVESLRQDDPIHVTIPHARRIERDLVVIHSSRSFGDGDLTRSGNLAVTSPARTLVDLAMVADRDRLIAIVDQALARRLVTATTLRAKAAAHLPGRGKVHRLLTILDDQPGGGVESALERAFLDLVRSAGLPLPRTQVVVSERGQFVARVDAVFPSGLIVELMSRRWHGSPLAVERDARRRRAIRLAGGDVIDIWADEVFNGPAKVVEELGRHLAVRPAVHAPR